MLKHFTIITRPTQLTIIILSLFIHFLSYGQNTRSPISIKVQNEYGMAIPTAVVMLKSDKESVLELTNEAGEVTFKLVPDNYLLEVQHISYSFYSQKLNTLTHNNLTVVLKAETNQLEEVVITAKEGTGLTSTSVINRRAMQHLQPSSFADLMELIPGGRAQDPYLGGVNKIQLREVGRVSSNIGGVGNKQYDTSSLGTLFVVDGAQLNSGANLQYTYGYMDNVSSGVNKNINISSGVDMRTISTDQIEKVEIIRGIPSVEYGNLTSGVVKITKKSGYSKWQARFKADGYSKLFAVNKGFESKDSSFKVNVGLDYLNAKPEPRNDLESYKRVTGTVRVSKDKNLNNGGLFSWVSNLSYTGSIDDAKSDPDIDLTGANKYKVDNQFYSLSNIVTYESRNESFFRSIELQTTFNQRFDKINQTKFVQLEAATALPLSTVDGEYDGFFPTANYIAESVVDGKPLDIFAKVVSAFRYKMSAISTDIRAGIDWQYSKNNGRGQVYDIYKPLDPKSTYRNRAYKDIPAYVTTALFAEHISSAKFGQHGLTLALGARGSIMQNLSNDFTMSGKMYIDPRVNVQWTLPSFVVANKEAKVDLTLGWGQQRLFPDLNLLYPEKYYRDVQQLNYFHSNPDYRTVNYKTSVFDPQNKALTPALNNKLEARLDLNWGFHQLTFTVFKERMSNGFRTMNQYGIFDYKRYDTSSIDHDHITSVPNKEDLPYEQFNENFLYNFSRNGSRTDKEGIEFQYSSNRIPVINTRVTINGAWFRTKQGNSLPTYRRGNSNANVNGKPYPYLGLYDEMEPKSKYEQLNSNLLLDTYIPKLDLQFSTSFQFNWYYLAKNEPMNGMPSYYVGVDGELRPYDAEEAKGTLLEQLVIPQHSNADKSRRTPMLMDVNLKLSKSFRNKQITVSMFANKLFTYYAPYSVNGTKVNRKGLRAPYFGMEINFNL
ncbi:TonB-dependent receptor [Myroides odoratimimus]|uniref:TonB-dependent receptor plug domain-containing protein n=1 Tax=Myroides odoratimimus CIP 101113 TaxID=883154 RepID=A0AAV3F660_9FLAO|nr:TonB-dependent receptor plug domain-containing protein [Myroides odoratimimus]EHO14376.1 hypothetical protein HMPREF9715_00813 [Myroides odoratimimus CIP 101113]